MNLFKYSNHIDGGPFENNILISVGRCKSMELNNTGWYIRLELPFTKDCLYDLSDGFKKLGPCRRILSIKKIYGVNKFITTSLWIPI